MSSLYSMIPLWTESQLKTELQDFLSWTEQYRPDEDVNTVAKAVIAVSEHLATDLDHLIFTTRNVLCEIAVAYEQAGQWEKACRFRKQIWAYSQRCFGREHPDTAKDIFDLVAAIKALEDESTTDLLNIENLLEEACDIAQKVPNELVTYHEFWLRLGQKCLHHGLPAEARELLVRSFDNSKNREDTRALASEAAFDLLTAWDDILQKDNSRALVKVCVSEVSRVFLEINEISYEGVCHLIFKACLRLGDEENACKAFSYLASEKYCGSQGGNHARKRVSCDGCGLSTERELLDCHACTSCWNTFYCQQCVSKLPESCAAHVLSDTSMIHAASGTNDLAHTTGDEAAQPGASPRFWLKALHEEYTSAVAEENAVGNSELDLFEGVKVDIPTGDTVETVVEQVTSWRRTWSLQCTPILLKKYFQLEFVPKVEYLANSTWFKDATSSLSTLRYQLGLQDGAFELVCSGILESIELATRKHSTSSASPVVSAVPRAHHPVYLGAPLMKGQGCVRVLKLLPASGFNEQLQGVLLTQTLAKSCDYPYDALSYVWGHQQSNGTSDTIYIRGHSVNITPTLATALRHMRTAGADRIVWADALCINQMDDDEKAEQVAMMQEIYSQAETVVAYLGELQPDLEPILDVLEQTIDFAIPKAELEVGLKLKNHTVLSSFMSLCSQPWWSRVWIQQEYAAANKDPILQLGTRTISTTNLRHLLKPLFVNTISAIAPYMKDPIANWKRNGYWETSAQMLCVQHTLEYRKNMVHDGQLHSISPLGDQIRLCRLKSTQLKDRIYGLRAFLDPITQVCFYPDYTQDDNTFCLKATAFLLIYEYFVKIFYMYPHRLPGSFPSWARDLSRPLNDTLHPSNLKAATSRGPIFLAILDGVLAMDAWLLDVIDDVVRPTTRSADERLQQLWEIEHTSSLMPTPRMRREQSSTVKSLSKLHEKTCLYGWTSVTSGCYPVSVLGLSGILNISKTLAATFEDVSSQLEAALQTTRNTTTHDMFLNASTSLEREPTEDEKQMTALCLLSINKKLGDLQCKLIDDSNTVRCIQGPALFDFEGLVEHVEHLYRPSRPSSPAQIPNIVQTLLEQKIERVGLYNASIPLDSISGPQRPTNQRFAANYGYLQALITDCHFEAEVRLRARMIIELARKLRNPDNCSGVDTTGLEGFQQDTRSSMQGRLDKITGEIARLRLSGASSFNQDELDKLEQVQDKLRAKITRWDANKQVYTYIESDQVMCDFLRSEVKDRTFFYTKQGLVGAGTPEITDIRAGDKILIVPRTDWPLIVRDSKQAGHLEIVGMAHIRGFDYDDFLKLPKKDQLPVQTFKFV